MDTERCFTDNGLGTIDLVILYLVLHSPSNCSPLQPTIFTSSVLVMVCQMKNLEDVALY